MGADRLIERLGELPALPTVYQRVREALTAPDGALETAASLIESDPSMSMRLLRVANSPLYGLSTKVDTILRALTLIGTTAAHHLVLSTALMTVFRDLPLGTVSMRSFWEHGIACGVAARLIARQGGRANPEHAYLAGLLHDIGRLPLYILEPLDMSAALQAHRERQGQLHDLEQQYLGIDHTELGAILLAHWQLPEVFSNGRLRSPCPLACAVLMRDRRRACRGPDRQQSQTRHQRHTLGSGARRWRLESDGTRQRATSSHTRSDHHNHAGRYLGLHGVVMKQVPHPQIPLPR
jgi:hypothetical protein